MDSQYRAKGRFNFKVLLPSEWKSKQVSLQTQTSTVTTSLVSYAVVDVELDESAEQDCA